MSAVVARVVAAARRCSAIAAIRVCLLSRAAERMLRAAPLTPEEKNRMVIIPVPGSSRSARGATPKKRQAAAVASPAASPAASSPARKRARQRATDAIGAASPAKRARAAKGAGRSPGQAGDLAGADSTEAVEAQELDEEEDEVTDGDAQAVGSRAVQSSIPASRWLVRDCPATLLPLVRVLLHSHARIAARRASSSSSYATGSPSDGANDNGATVRCLGLHRFPAHSSASAASTRTDTATPALAASPVLTQLVELVVRCPQLATPLPPHTAAQLFSVLSGFSSRADNTDNADLTASIPWLSLLAALAPSLALHLTRALRHAHNHTLHHAASQPVLQTLSRASTTSRDMSSSPAALSRLLHLLTPQLAAFPLPPPQPLHRTLLAAAWLPPAHAVLAAMTVHQPRSPHALLAALVSVHQDCTQTLMRDCARRGERDHFTAALQSQTSPLGSTPAPPAPLIVILSPASLLLPLMTAASHSTQPARSHALHSAATLLTLRIMALLRSLADMGCLVLITSRTVPILGKPAPDKAPTITHSTTDAATVSSTAGLSAPSLATPTATQQFALGRVWRRMADVRAVFGGHRACARVQHELRVAGTRGEAWLQEVPADVRAQVRALRRMERLAERRATGEVTGDVTAVGEEEAGAGVGGMNGGVGGGAVPQRGELRGWTPCQCQWSTNDDDMDDFLWTTTPATVSSPSETDRVRYAILQSRIHDSTGSVVSSANSCADSETISKTDLAIVPLLPTNSEITTPFREMKSLLNSSSQFNNTDAMVCHVLSGADAREFGWQRGASASVSDTTGRMCRSRGELCAMCGGVRVYMRLTRTTVPACTPSENGSGNLSAEIPNAWPVAMLPGDGVYVMERGRGLVGAASYAK